MKQMYTVELPRKRVLLKSPFGDVVKFRSYTHFISQYLCGSINTRINDFNIYYFVDSYGITRRCLYSIAYWEFGDAIKSKKIRYDIEKVKLQKKKVNKQSYFYLMNHKVFDYRRDPVPLIRKSYHFYGIRKVRTTQEKRLYFIAIYEGVKIRGRRSFKSLPSTHDDIMIFYQKTWKKFRKHQWKEKFHENKNRNRK